MANYQTIVTTLAQGLKNQVQKLNDLEITLSSITNELNDFEGEYSKEVKTLNDRIDAINVQIDKTIKQAIKDIEFPTTINEDDVLKLIKDNIKNIDEDKLRSDLKAYINDSIPEPLPTDEIKEDLYTKLFEDVQRLKPDPIDYEAIYSEIDQKLKDFEAPNIDEIKKSLKAFVAQAVSRINVTNGSDGIGIEDIKRVKDDLVIYLTDGSEKKIKLPKPPTQFVGGGGGVSLQVASSTLIVSTDTDIELKPQSQNILVDCSSGEVNIKLPNPIDCFITGRSYKIGITKIDASNNKIVINSYSGETIALETLQELYQRQEVLNFITDGKNWHMGA